MSSIGETEAAKVGGEEGTLALRRPVVRVEGGLSSETHDDDE